MRKAITAIAVVAFFLSPTRVQAGKMDIVRIVIEGGQLAAPVEITDLQAVSRFRVGAGPGDFKLTPGGAQISNYPAQCFIVDWSRGFASPPEELQEYDVLFITTRKDRNTYVVRYGVDHNSNAGYVYNSRKDGPWLHRQHLDHPTRR